MRSQALVADDEMDTAGMEPEMEPCSCTLFVLVSVVIVHSDSGKVSKRTGACSSSSGPALPWMLPLLPPFGVKIALEKQKRIPWSTINLNWSDAMPKPSELYRDRDLNLVCPGAVEN